MNLWLEVFVYYQTYLYFNNKKKQTNKWFGFIWFIVLIMYSDSKPISASYLVILSNTICSADFGCVRLV